MPDVVEQIQREAASAEARTRTEHRVARGDLRASAGQAKEEVSEESRVAKVKAYQPFEEPLQALKREIAFETRRGYLPGYKSDPDPLRAQRERLKAQREGPLREADIWRTGALGTVERSLAEEERKLDESLEASLAGIRSWKESAISEYQAWEAEQPVEVKEVVPTPVISNQAEIDEFERAHVEINPDEWVPRSDWAKLTSSQKEEVRTTGSYTVPGVTIQAEGYAVEEKVSPGVTIRAGGYAVAEESDFEHLTKVLGREPTLGEMESYARGEAPSYGGHFGTLTAFPIIGPIAHQFRLGAELLIPGTQSQVETAFKETLPKVAEARQEWYKKTFGGVPSVMGQVGYGFYPAVRVLSPRVAIGEIARSEWIQTGLTAATIATPLWVPPIVRGVKSIPQVPATFRAKLGTYPFSEAAGLLEKPSPAAAGRSGLTIGPPTRIPGRVRVPEAYEQAFRVSKPYEPIPGRKAPHTTYTPTKVPGAMTSEEIAALYGKTTAGGWTPPKVAVVTQVKTAPVTWAKLPTGRYMPAGAKPLYVTDVPFAMPLQAPQAFPALAQAPFPVQYTGTSISPGTRTVPDVKVAPSTKTSLDAGAFPTPALYSLHTPARVKPWAQPVPYPVVRGLTLPQVKTAPVVGISPASQVRTLTSLQTLLRIEPVTKTQVLTKTKPITRVAVGTIAGVSPFIPKGPTPKGPWPKLPWFGAEPTQKPGKPKKWPAGTITWRQGFVRKYIAPPYNDVKPTSVYEGTGSGVPKDTIKIVGGPAPITAQIDLGVVDVFVEGKSQRIKFIPGGLKTDVGKRHPSKTKGMSVTRSAGFKKVRV